MAIVLKVWDMPTLPVRAQLFYAPGQAFEGGFTSGGVRVTSPEPGGRAYLETELALQKGEWDDPFSSWLMSKTNGDIFRVKLVATPQLVPAAAMGIVTPETPGVPWSAEGFYDASPWDNSRNWSLGDTGAEVYAVGLEGSTIMQVDMTGFGPIIKHGHVIGHEDNSYVVDDIEYEDGIATITVKPPLRRDIAVGDLILFRPTFTGSISNGAELRATYEAMNVGLIQPARILFSEVIL